MKASSPYEVFVSQAKTVTPFTSDFKELLQKMLAHETYTNDGALIESLRDYTNTTNLLETKAAEMRHLLGDPDTVIRELTSGGAATLLSIAYLAQAFQILHDRCALAEKEIPIV